MQTVLDFEIRLTKLQMRAQFLLVRLAEAEKLEEMLLGSDDCTNAAQALVLTIAAEIDSVNAEHRRTTKLLAQARRDEEKNR